MQFASLGSGSRGNATLVKHKETLLLVDCGFTYKETVSRLKRLNLGPEQVTAILVTHEHSDHASGVGVFSRKQQVPVYLSRGTARHRSMEKLFACEYVIPETGFVVGDIDVLPVAVPHDAREPVQFVFTAGKNSLGVLTDLGCITPHIIECFSSCTALLLESNHDLDMLMAGPYPLSLKQRVASDWGHLNNHQAAYLLSHVKPQQTNTVVMAHLSETNNHPSHVSKMLEEEHPHLLQQCDVTIACQNEGFGWISV